MYLYLCVSIEGCNIVFLDIIIYTCFVLQMQITFQHCESLATSHLDDIEKTLRDFNTTAEVSALAFFT